LHGDSTDVVALLKDTLDARLGRFARSGDPSELLNPAALDEANRLLDAAQHGGIGPEAIPLDVLTTLAALHLFRFRLLPDGQDEGDIQMTLAFYGLVAARAPELVPDEILSLLLTSREEPSADPAQLVAEGQRAIAEYERDGLLASLDAAVNAFRDAVAAALPGDPRIPGYLWLLGSSLILRFGQTGTASDLDIAVGAGWQAAELAPPGHPDHPRCLAMLGLALRTRFEHSGDIEDLDTAVEAGWEAASMTPPGDPSVPRYLSELSAALVTRFMETGVAEDLTAAVAAGRRSVEIASPGATGLPGYLSSLGGVLHTRFEHTGDIADLDAAIEAGRRAADLSPPGSTDLPGRLSNLGALLRTRFEHTGNAADLDAAIACGQQAADHTPPGDPSLAIYLSNLGLSLRVRAENGGDPADLDAAVEAGRRAADLTPPGHHGLPGRLSNLGLSLRARFEHSGDAADLDAAAEYARQAGSLTPAGHPDLPQYLSNLGAALLARFGRIGDAADLDAAVDSGRRAVGLTPAGHPDLPQYLSNLGGSLRARFASAGDPADLDAAIDAVQQAADYAPAGHPDLPMYVSNLGAVLMARFSRTEDGADLDVAIAAGQSAAGVIPPGHPGLAMCLSNLGTCLHARFARSADAADLDAAIRYWRQASEMPTGRPADRLTAAQRWGAAAADARQHAAAADGYEAAVRLLPTVAWHGLDRATREGHLERWAGLAADAAASAVLAGRSALAVELLEQGRSILWTQALNLRGDLSRLEEEHPDLAAQLDRIRLDLDIPPTGAPNAPPGSSTRPGPASRPREAGEERRQAAREWDQVLEQIRAQHGFSRFLTTVPYASLKETAAAGPVVIVNASRHGCHALIIHADRDQPFVAALPGLTLDEAADQADKMLQAIAGDLRRDPEDDRRDLLEMLGWLWDAIAEPVLTVLGHVGPPRTGSPLPRVWWCLTGPLAVLPIHAAGRYPRRDDLPASGGDCVPDRVISSYTPTLAALARTRRATPQAQVRQLAVGMPYTPGQGRLPAVPAELQVLASLFPSAGGNLQLTGQEATRASVLAAMPGHSWLHLACHAGQRDDDPSRSGFALHDGALTIADLASLPTQTRGLAFLSACETAAGSVRHLDEAVHLASAMQFLGYQHVIATMWTIADPPGPAIARTVYTELTRSGHPVPDEAAAALHQAVQQLRLTHPASPQLWAPYIHLGS
jgi:tetratricopeptide (TPR) repeat protein